MSHVNIYDTVLLPNIHSELAASVNVTLNAAGETCHNVGYIQLENPTGGSKTISAAGGGSIVWLTSTVTFANAGTTFRVGIQDLAGGASNPGQGDGTFDVQATFTGGGGGVTGSAVQTSVMTSGTKTINHGDLVAITFATTARAGSDSITVAHNAMDSHFGALVMPGVTDNTSGAYTRNTLATPNCYILFDDGSVGWIAGTSWSGVPPTALSFNSGTGTADEYGNLLVFPTTFYAMGVAITMSDSSFSGDFELLLYTDPLGTPAVQRTITVDASNLMAINGRLRGFFLFSSPYLMRANTPVGITIRPTTTNNLTIYYRDVNNSVGGRTTVPNSYCYSIRRLDNSGAFSDYNGGTAKTRKVSISVFGSYREQGVNMCSGQVGVY